MSFRFQPIFDITYRYAPLAIFDGQASFSPFRLLIIAFLIFDIDSATLSTFHARPARVFRFQLSSRGRQLFISSSSFSSHFHYAITAIDDISFSFSF
jgi:hypothetical protein